MIGRFAYFAKKTEKVRLKESGKEGKDGRF